MPVSTSLNDNDFIIYLYLALLGREPDERGMRTYLDDLANGRLSRETVIKQVLNSAEYANRRLPVMALPAEPLGCTRHEAMAVFEQFLVPDVPGRAGYITNFMGCVSEIAVLNLLAGSSGRVEGVPIPGNFHGETLEWVGTLRAVLEAGQSFSMIELGAGWAPWCVIGATAARRKNVGEIRVIGIEADAGHVSFMERNFAANGLAPDEAEALHGAIGLENGTAYFPKAEHADQVYSGAAAYSDGEQQAGPFADFMRANTKLVEAVEAVPCFALSDQINKFSVLDLVHCDIQGSELELIPGSIDILTEKVKRIIVGTHSFEIDRKLAEIMGASGWICEGVSACRMKDDANLACDGMQVWRNGNFY